MSIEAELQLLIDENRLLVLEPLLPSTSFTRAVLMTREIANLVYTGTQDVDRAERCGDLRADLEAFATGDVVTVCLTPYKAGKAYMGRLHPIGDGVFDIRSRDPSPAIRVLGGFPMPDVFIAIAWAPRSVKFGWSKKLPLGGRESIEWRKIISRTKTSWKSLLPQNPRIPGDELNDIISKNVRPS